MKTSSRITQLRELCQTHPMGKKVLVTRSHATGHQWLERLCREYGAAVQIEVATPEALASRHAKLALLEKGLTAVSSDEAYWIVHRLMYAMAREDEQAYVNEAMLAPGVVGCFHRAVIELREARVCSDQLQLELFESAAKGEYIRRLLGRYERELSERGLADTADLARAVERDTRTDTIYIIDRLLPLSAAEQEILRIIAGERMVVLEADEAFTSVTSAFPAGETEFFHALGPIAEIREVFRRLAERGIPVDQAEMIVSDASAYVPVVYTSAVQHGIECTYSGGIPLEFTVTGQAVNLYLQWLESDYHTESILKAWKLGVIRPLPDDSLITIGGCIRVLERSGIGWGKDRYKLLNPSSWLENDAPIASHLNKWFQSWFACLPEENTAWTPGAVAAGIRKLLKSVPVHNEQEASAQAGICRQAAIMEEAEACAVERLMAIRYAREWIEGLTFGGNGVAVEGRLHVSSLQDGGQSGRPYTFIVGMEEENWTISARQDPILLDEERVRISERLVTAKERAERAEHTRASMLGAIRGSCTMSFCSYHISDKQERNAAFELLQCFRNKTGVSTAGYDQLLDSLPSAAGVLYRDGAALALDSQEVWLRSLIARDRSIRDGLDEVLEAYPSLKAGELAAHSRMDMAIGEYDGVFDPLDDGPVAEVTSVSKLELYARCPMQYFYQEVLRVRPKEIAEFDRTRWLDAAQRGTLLHSIYQQYWTETMENGGVHDRERLERITENTLKKAKEEIPSPSEHVLRREWEEIHRDAAIFWKGEQGRSSRPRYMELALHSEEEPFAVELGEELTLPLRGYVDRVDEVAPHTYQIIDYKSGSSRKYREDQYFAGGTQLQHAVYARAVEQWLRRKGIDPEAKVAYAGYYFPTYRGQGHEVTRAQNRSEDTGRLVSHMLKAMREGIFPPTKDQRQCGWCDYSEVCGQHADYMKDKRKDVDNGERLRTLLEVESYG
jgi:ATP-dependent helicase/nuclease subunit B